MRISKKWYASKTLWINLLSMTSILAQTYYKTDVLPPEVQVSLLAVINIVLRTVTKNPINW